MGASTRTAKVAIKKYPNQNELMKLQQQQQPITKKNI